MIKWLKTLRVLMLALLLGVGGLSAVTITGCRDKGPAEEAGENIDEAGEEVRDAGEDAAEEVEDAVD